MESIMKVICSLIFIITLIVNCQAQLRHTLEIVLTVSGVDGEESFTYTLDAIETVWANDSITTSYDQAQEVIVGNLDSSSTSKGWDIFWHQQGREPFAHGLYKLSTSNDDGFIYLDFRDSKYANQVYQGGGTYPTDIYIHYFGNTDEFGIEDDNDHFVKVDNQSLNRIWDINNNGTAPLTTTYVDFWDYCLGMTETSNSHPRIVWGPHPTFKSPAGYKVYRAVSVGSTSNPDTLTYAHAATTNSSTYNWTDTDIDIGGTYNYWYYYVKAYNGVKHSGASNIVYVPGSMNKPFMEKKEISSLNSYRLKQNYPNPFNPSSTVSFDLPRESTVRLQIYDVQGRIVSTLVNGTLDAGTHSVKFNSDGLPSGVYLYRIEAGVFQDVKKMILLR
jgi:hypothetical protein